MAPNISIEAAKSGAHLADAPPRPVRSHLEEDNALLIIAEIPTATEEQAT
jgi:hypothetical protein